MSLQRLGHIGCFAARTVLSSSKTVFTLARRSIALPITSRCAKYSKHGLIHRVISIEDEVIHEVPDDQVLVKMLAAAINPSDVNMVEGFYGIDHPLPAVAGSEGVGVVLEKGPNVEHLEVGDWVIPSKPGFGTWRTHAVCPESMLDKISNQIPPHYAATVAVNPCTAYRLLHDFAKLKPGDVVMQNGCNSAVGQAVVQLARSMGVRTINILRDRPNFNEIAVRLRGLGADLVLSQSDVISEKRDVMAAIRELPQPSLGLNCVGGNSATAIAGLLKNGASMVTYGGMSRKPITCITKDLIFNDIVLRGFWLNRWVDTHTQAEREEMIKAITDLVIDGKLQMFHHKEAFTEMDTALHHAIQNFRDRKVVLMMDDSMSEQ